MVSFNVYRSTASGAYVEGVCLATDEKPITGIANGSILYAVDPTDGSTTRYMFDQSTATWIDAACPCSGGGSSGGSGGGVEPLHINVDSNTQLFDKTWEEIYSAFANGRPCFIHVPAGAVPDIPNSYITIAIDVTSYPGDAEYTGRTVYAVTSGTQLGSYALSPDSFPKFAGFNDGPA